MTHPQREGHRSVPTRLGVREVNASHDVRWNAYVASHPEGTGYHHAGWLKVLATEYDTRQLHLLCEDERGTVHGILPMVFTSGVPLGLAGPIRVRRLASLPRTPTGGPLATSAAAAERLITSAVDLARAERRTALQFRRMRADIDGLVDGVVGQPWRLSYTLQLPPPGQHPVFGDPRNHRRIRWAVNKAEREGVKIRRGDVGDVRPWYRLYLETMRAHVVPPRPLRFFISLLELPELRGLAELQVAEVSIDRSRRLIAGSFFLRFGATVSYAFNGVDPRSLRLRANDALQWQAIHAAWRDGFRIYDLGEVTEPNDTLSDFKRKWGATAEMMFRYYSPPLPLKASRGEMSPEMKKRRALAAALWNQLPLRVTAVLGDAAWKFS